MTPPHELRDHILTTGVDDWVSLAEVAAVADRLSDDDRTAQSLVVDVLMHMVERNEIVGIGNYPPTEKPWPLEPADLRHALARVLEAPRSHTATPYVDDRWLGWMDVWIVTQGSSGATTDAAVEARDLEQGPPG